MSFPSLGGTKQENLSQVWNEARSAAWEIKINAQTFRGLITAGTTADIIVDFINILAAKKDQLTGLVAVPGIAAYAQSQINDNTLNIATEYSAMLDALNAVIAWVLANTPKDGSGYLLICQFSADNSGRRTYRSFTSGTLAGLVTVVDALLATID